MAIIFKCKKCGESIIVNQLKPGEIALCKMCNTENVVPENNSEKKSTENIKLSPSKTANEKVTSFKKYPALMTIAGVLKFVAYVVLIISIGILIFGLTLLSAHDKSLGIMTIASSIIFGFVGFILMLAFSELIKVFLDIEYNTRN